TVDAGAVRWRGRLPGDAGRHRPLPLRAVRDVHRHPGAAHHVDGGRGHAQWFRGDEPRAESSRGNPLTSWLARPVFFILAKVLWFLLQPSSLMVGALTLGAVLAFTTWRRLARVFLCAATFPLLVGGLSPLGGVMIRPLEQPFFRPDLDRPGAPVTGIIVLGGAEDSRAMDSPQLAALNEAAERYTEAVALVWRLPAARLVF